MAEGAISQALYSRPRWWSKPYARNVVPVHDGRRSFLPSPSLQAALVERTLRTKIHTETCWRENAFTQAFSFTNVHRANFLPKPPCHAKSARPRGRLYPSNCSQWSFLRFTSGIFTKKRHRTEQGFSLCPARCLDVQTIVRCLLLADLAHRQVGCGSSHKD